MLRKKSKIRYALEFVILVAVVTVAVQFTKLLKPTKLGFFCNDLELNYPKRKETYPTLYLYITVFIIPSVTIFVNEAIIVKKRGSLVTANQVKAFLIYIYEIFYVLILVAFFAKISIDVIKASTGRLRPHFMAVCAPVNQTTRISISDTCLPGQFIEDYVCSKEDNDEFYYSFVSGHSAFMIMSVGVTVVYIQYRVLWMNIGLIKNLVQVLLVVFSCYVSLTRVSNYYHFGSDVLAGALVGLIFVFICCYTIKEILTGEMQHFLGRLTSSIEAKNDVVATYSGSIQTVY